ncbi:DUF1016 N-terminal domain-containing protein [Variovorax sp. UC122_21]|uniref:DUF1016 N-terminal domain-containing protein n=1 Tax=Variovorax sp. UC122_21 TaxID=3374554 RepID=UPI0037583AD3
MTLPSGEAADYASFIEALKERVAAARQSAARAVNHGLIALYWDIGEAILHKQQAQAWGEAVVERIARDLRAAFPGTQGFSARNVWDMRRMVEAYSEPGFLRQLVAESSRRKGCGRKSHRRGAARETVQFGGNDSLFALRSKTNPIGVAEYQLQAALPAELRGKLPSVRQLQQVVRGALPPPVATQKRRGKD